MRGKLLSLQEVMQRGCSEERPNQNLNNICISGTSDPYVKFKVGGRLLYKSKTLYRDLNPIWDETFTIPIEDAFVPVHIKVST